MEFLAIKARGPNFSVKRVVRDNRDACNLRFNWIASISVNNMVIGLPVYLQLPFVGTGGHHGLVTNRQYRKVGASWLLWILDANLPRFTRKHIGTKCLNVTAKVDKCRGNMLTF